MSENERLVEVQLLGHQFRFYTGSSEEELDAILRLVQDVVDVETDQKTGTLAMGKIAVLACLNDLTNEIRALIRE